MYKGYGIHHMALGVKSLENMKSFYQDILEFNNIFVDFPKAEYPALHEVIRVSHPIYAGILFTQKAGGIIVELIEMVDPVGRPIRKDFKYGDIGLSKITIAVSNVERFYKEYKNKVNYCSVPKSTKIPEWGDYHFVFCRDPEGNLIEFVSGKNIPVTDKFGGVCILGISVTDLNRSIAFYQKYLGFDKVVIKSHTLFSGLVDEVSGRNKTKVLSCLLASSEGEGMVELFEVMEPRGRSIPFATRWGDFGYLQICLNGKPGADMLKIASYFEEQGMEFISSPQFMHDEREGVFFYMKDPDGIPIEFLNFLK